jgi:hypothetical protein
VAELVQLKLLMLLTYQKRLEEAVAQATAHLQLFTRPPGKVQSWGSDVGLVMLPVCLWLCIMQCPSHPPPYPPTRGLMLLTPDCHAQRSVVAAVLAVPLPRPSLFADLGF